MSHLINDSRGDFIFSRRLHRSSYVFINRIVNAARIASISGWGCGCNVGGRSTIITFEQTSKSHGPVNMKRFTAGA